MGAARCRSDLQAYGGAVWQCEDLLPTLRQSDHQGRQPVTGAVTYASSQPNAYAPAQPSTGIIFYGDVIIDATHEGDLAVWAGAPYRVGREPRSRLEPHAGSIYFYDRTGEILPGSTGQGDRAVVSYGCRLTIQNYSDREYPAHALASPPPGYKKADYEHSAYDTAEYNPNGKLEMIMYPFGSEVQEANWLWPESSRAERARLYEIYKNHALGFSTIFSMSVATRWVSPRTTIRTTGTCPIGCMSARRAASWAITSCRSRISIPTSSGIA